MKQPKRGTHYIEWVSGNGHKCYEWVSRETHARRQWAGSRHEFLSLWAHDLTTLPADYLNTSA